MRSALSIAINPGLLDGGHHDGCQNLSSARPSESSGPSFSINSVCGGLFPVTMDCSRSSVGRLVLPARAPSAVAP